MDLSWLSEYGPWGIILAVVIFALAVTFDDVFRDKIQAKFYLIALKITNKRSIEKRYISSDLRGKINNIRKKLHFGDTILPCAIDVQWVDTVEEESIDIKEGEYIIKLDNYSKQKENIVKMIDIVVRKTTLLGIRNIIHQQLGKAIDINMVRKIILEIKNREIYDWYFKYSYKPYIDKSDEVFKCRNEQIKILDEKGIFTRILLLEYDRFGKKDYGMSYNVRKTQELVEIMHFLYKIASKKGGEDVPLIYIGVYFKIGVVLVAKPQKIIYQGIKPYVKAVNTAVIKKAETVYIIQYDKEYLGELDVEKYEIVTTKMKEIINKVKKETILKVIYDDTYNMIDDKGRKRTCRVIGCAIGGI